MRSIRSHGMTTMSYDRFKGHATKYDINDFGYNYRLDDIRASIGIIQLQKIDNDLAKRKKIRDRYLERLKNNSKIIIPFSENREFVSNYIFPFILKESKKNKRDFLRKELHDRGIQTSIHYPSIHRFTIYKNEYTNLPITDYVSKNEITLPMYSNLRLKQVDYICDNLNDILTTL